MRLRSGVFILIVLAGCPSETPAPDAATPINDAAEADGGDAATGADRDGGGPDDRGETADDAGVQRLIEVIVRLDNAPAPDTLVLQGGGELFLRTDEESRVLYPLDETIPGEHIIFASHPEARIKGQEVRENHQGPLVIDLVRYDRSDNASYTFQDPGEPTRSPNTTQCGHCHQTINQAWFDSPHRTSASNPRLRDLYFGPGGVREQLGGTTFGACADCHAPGIDGQLGGRDLADATGFAEQYGVHCDVCHRVDQIDLLREPGVAGRLMLTRPSEEGPVSLGAGGRLPLTFGPSHDSSNPRMGSVQRDHFRRAELCAGCHELNQAALLPNTSIDRARWPDGKIPVMSTFEEWRGGPFADSVPCQECHMPPDPMVLNGADLQFFPFSEIGVQGGWVRVPGSTRRHSWIGPRARNSGLVEVAAAVFIEKRVANGELTAEVTVKNTGCGHALPTGEPLRSLILLVEARCGDRSLDPIGGDVVPDFGGFTDKKLAGEDFTTWPTAQVGDQIRVVRRPGGYYDYVGFGPFGDGRFDAREKGMPLEAHVRTSTITEVLNGVVTATPAIAGGDVAYLVRGDAHAGASGFAFARILTDAGGRREVPHYAAVDVASDNRILPSAKFTATHVFRATCSDPTVYAKLIHRPYPLALSWPFADQIITEVRR